MVPAARLERYPIAGYTANEDYYREPETSGSAAAAARRHKY
jgi:hypothetical protein